MRHNNIPVNWKPPEWLFHKAQINTDDLERPVFVCAPLDEFKCIFVEIQGIMYVSCIDHCGLIY